MPSSKAIMGRPTKYDPKYCQQLIDFYDQPSTVERIKTVTLKSGVTIEEEYDAPNKPVHVIDFCDKIGITVSTFYEWQKNHKDFSEAYTHAKEYLARNIVDNALLNNYNAGFAALVTKNWLGWRDKTENETTFVLPSPILDIKAIDVEETKRLN